MDSVNAHLYMPLVPLSCPLMCCSCASPRTSSAPPLSASPSPPSLSLPQSRPSSHDYDSSWLTGMYLCETWSSNLGFGLIDDPRFVEGEAGEHINARVARATALITGALELRRKTYLHQELDAAGDDSAARKQLMSHGDASKTQRFLFGTTRRPGPAAGKLDVLAHFAEHESEHFTVLCNNRIWVVDGAAARSATDLTKCLKCIVAESERDETNRSFSMGAMTHDFRARWRSARAELERSVANRERFAVIDSAAFTVCLDSRIPGDEQVRFTCFALPPREQPPGNMRAAPHFALRAIPHAFLRCGHTPPLILPPTSQGVLASVGAKSSNRWYDHTLQVSFCLPLHFTRIVLTI